MTKREIGDELGGSEKVKRDTSRADGPEHEPRSWGKREAERLKALITNQKHPCQPRSFALSWVECSFQFIGFGIVRIEYELCLCYGAVVD